MKLSTHLLLQHLKHVTYRVYKQKMKQLTISGANTLW